MDAMLATGNQNVMKLALETAKITSVTLLHLIVYLDARTASLGTHVSLTAILHVQIKFVIKALGIVLKGA